MHGEQEEIEQSRKGHERECPSSIEESARQHYSELIMEVVGNCCWWWRVWNGSGRNGQVWVGMEMGCC